MVGLPGNAVAKSDGLVVLVPQLSVRGSCTPIFSSIPASVRGAATATEIAAAIRRITIKPEERAEHYFFPPGGFFPRAAACWASFAYPADRQLGARRSRLAPWPAWPRIRGQSRSAGGSGVFADRRILLSLFWAAKPCVIDRDAGGLLARVDPADFVQGRCVHRVDADVFRVESTVSSRPASPAGDRARIPSRVTRSCLARRIGELLDAAR